MINQDTWNALVRNQRKQRITRIDPYLSWVKEKELVEELIAKIALIDEINRLVNAELKKNPSMPKDANDYIYHYSKLRLVLHEINKMIKDDM